MAPQDVLYVNIDPELKQQLSSAATQQGQSLTAFVTSALENELKRAAKKPAVRESKDGQGALPSFFRALCATAQSGGSQGYRAAGHELARHTGRLLDLSDDNADKIEELVTAICEDRDDDVLAWYDREFPRCMKLIPRRRWKQFLLGVIDARVEDLISL